MGKQTRKGKNIENKVKNPGDSGSLIWHPGFKPRAPVIKDAPLLAKQEEKEKYLEELLSI